MKVLFFNILTLQNQNLYKKLFQDRVDEKDDMLDKNLFHKNILQMILYDSLNPLSYPKFVNSLTLLSW